MKTQAFLSRAAGVMVLFLGITLFAIGTSSALAAEENVESPYQTLLGRWEWQSRGCYGSVVLTFAKIWLKDDGSAEVEGTYECSGVPQTHKGDTFFEKEKMRVKLTLSLYGSTLDMRLREKRGEFILEGSGWFRDHWMDLWFVKKSSAGE